MSVHTAPMNWVEPSSAVQRLLTPSRTSLLVLTLAVSLVVRIQGLSVNGFSQDEVAKLHAIEAYRQGDFSANAEHPMLMKLVMWGSVAGAERWNTYAPGSMAIAPETALRLPNAVAGALTPLAVFGAAASLLDPTTGLVAAVFVALDPTIISVNRIGKEDTFLMLFFMLATACYERAKNVWPADRPGANRLYNAAGACFGLMLASKYLPHLLGLYGLFNFAAMYDGGGNAPRLRQYLTTMLATFLVVDFAILLPDTWAYVGRYASGEQWHHGYLYDGQLYVNRASMLLWGVPWTYYFRLIATKMPLIVFAAAIAAVPSLVTRRRERGFVWLRVFLVVQLLGYSMIAAKFQRYALPLLVVIDMLAAIAVVAAFRWIRERSGLPAPLRMATGAAGAALLVLAVVQAPLTASPHFSTYQNAVGARLAPAVTVYPEEAYDYGVREAVAVILREAQPEAVIVSDADMVVDYYLQRSARRDIAARSLSRYGVQNRGEQWVLVQDSRRSFENASLVTQLRATRPPWREYQLRGTTVLQVFKIPS